MSSKPRGARASIATNGGTTQWLANRLRLRAGEAELVLERPSVRRLAYLVSRDELQGRWEMLEVSWFPPGGGMAGVGLSEAPRLANDRQAEAIAHGAVDLAKTALGERGPVWWDDGAPDLNRHMARTSPYAAWFAEMDAGGA